jgi:hypothetical protein
VNHYLTGGRVVLVATCTVQDTPTDPTTVTFTRQVNDQPPVSYIIGSPEVVKLATGVFACTVEVTEPGRERWRFESTGACQAAAEDQFDVLASSL